MQNKVAVSTNTYHGFSLDEALKGIADAGFKYVELTGVVGWTEHVHWNMSDAQIKEVLDKVSGYGLEAIALSGHSNILDESGLGQFLKNIDLASKLGCSYIISATGETHGDESEIEDESVVLSALKPILEKCEEKGLILALETHGNIFNTGKKMAEIVKKAGSKSVGINYDTANVIFYGRVQPYGDLKESVESVNFFHLKDKAGKVDEWNFPAVGKGDLDFKEIFSTLEQAGYKGPLSVEIEFTPDGPGPVENVHKAVKDSFQTIERLM